MGNKSTRHIMLEHERHVDHLFYSSIKPLQRLRLMAVNCQPHTSVRSSTVEHNVSQCSFILNTPLIGERKATDLHHFLALDLAHMGKLL